MPRQLHKRLLLVDDDRDTLDSIQQGLEALAGATVVTASSGEQALHALASNEVDAMVTDYRMPDMDGLQLSQKARRMKPHLAIVMITAFNDLDLQDAAARAGICEVLAKPIDVDPLIDSVQACCEAQ